MSMTVSHRRREPGFWRNTWENRAHVVMALPAFLILFFMMYVPMSGLVMAFKNFNYADGVFGSPWCKFDNFKFLIVSGEKFKTITLNTLMYYFMFTIVGTVLNIMVP